MNLTSPVLITSLHLLMALAASAEVSPSLKDQHRCLSQVYPLSLEMPMSHRVPPSWKKENPKGGIDIHSPAGAPGPAGFQPIDMKKTYPFYVSGGKDPGLYVFTANTIHFYKREKLVQECVENGHPNTISFKLKYVPVLNYSFMQVPEESSASASQLNAINAMTSTLSILPIRCELEESDFLNPQSRAAAAFAIQTFLSQKLTQLKIAFKFKTAPEAIDRSKNQTAQRIQVMKQVRAIYSSCQMLGDDLKTTIRDFESAVLPELTPFEKDELRRDNGAGLAI